MVDCLRQTTAAIERLIADRDRLRAIAAVSIHHPVLSLPAEMVEVVFVHCLPQISYPSATHAPLLMAQICRQWR
ncbi:hypothetical protein DFH09DRAFT_929256 [Mycena vulgaris]|nr:hypothetical protein DFH09DRAFT_929256 [Mycena vulgaris]